MFNPEDMDFDELSESRALAESLLDNPKERAEPLLTNEVQQDATEFLIDLGLLEEMGLDVPVVNGPFGMPIPISVKDATWALNSQNRSPRFPSEPMTDSDYPTQEQIYYALSAIPLQMHSRKSVEISLAPSSKARYFFTEGAARFLAVRRRALSLIAHVGLDGDQIWPKFTYLRRSKRRPKSWSIVEGINDPPSDPSLAPGQVFTVHTELRNLEVRWTPSYFVSWVHFGGPETPVSKALETGIYCFGALGGPYGGAVQFDPERVTSLPGHTSVYLPY